MGYPAKSQGNEQQDWLAVDASWTSGRARSALLMEGYAKARA
jgi:hypothetical protein